MSKYTPVWEYVQKAAPRLLTFDAIQRICGILIDHSFLNCKNELAAYGYTVQKINMKDKTVLFAPITDPTEYPAAERPLVLYVHGKSGNAKEAEHYKPLFPNCDVVGLAYKSDTPWEAKEEFSKAFENLSKGYAHIILIANSIGAYFSMHALPQQKIKTAYFISPFVNMEKWIRDKMAFFNISEEMLKEAGTVVTDFGETLSYAYLLYIQSHPICWTVPTHILYGANDTLIARDTIFDFSKAHNFSLTVMENGEHWFHTEAQMRFLDTWIAQHNTEPKKNSIGRIPLGAKTNEKRSL